VIVPAKAMTSSLKVTWEMSLFIGSVGAERRAKAIKVTDHAWMILDSEADCAGCCEHGEREPAKEVGVAHSGLVKVVFVSQQH
jgi:hypothetical protein